MEDNNTLLWINEFTNFIQSLDINENLKNIVINKLKGQYDLIKHGMINDEIFGTHQTGKPTELKTRECNSFFNYLYSLIEKKGTKYFELALLFALNNNDMSIIDSFIRFIVITNFDDIEIDMNFNIDKLMAKKNDFGAEYGYIRAYLGGFLLCDLSSFSYHELDEGKYLDFGNLHSRKNMKRTKVGSLLINELIKKVLSTEELRECSIGSCNVRKDNTGGKKFYEKAGFKFLDENDNVVDYHYYDEYVKVKREEHPELSDTEFLMLKNKMRGNFRIIIPSKEKEEVLRKGFSKPYVEFNGMKLDSTLSFNTEKKM